METHAQASPEEPARPRRRWVNLLLNLSLALASLLLLLLLLEGVGFLIMKLDRTGYYEPDYRNSLGMREPREPGETAGDRVILMLGDSHTYGVGVRYEDSYPARLEAELEARDPDARVAVINGGIGGSDTQIAFSQLERLYPLYKPEVVVLGFHSADISQNRIAQRTSRETDLTVARRAEAAPRSAEEIEEMIHVREEEFSTLWLMHGYLRRKSHAMTALSFYYKCYLIKFLPAPDADFLEQGLATREFQPSVRFLDQMNDYLVERDVELVLLSIPPLNRFDSYPNERLDETLAEYAESRGARFVSPLPALSRHRAADLRVSKRDGHYNEDGNRVLGEVLADFFTNSGLLDDDAAE